MSSNTILSVLSRPNPTVNPWRMRTGQNTISNSYLHVENWEEWTDFNYDTLREIFKDIVEAAWPDPPAVVRWSSLDLTYGDEDGFEHQVLSRETMPTVNAALLRAQQIAGTPFYLHVARKGRCTYGEDNRLTPDWTLVQNEKLAEDGQYVNLLPGDSKVSAKWTPGMLNSHKDEWRRPVQQVLSYANDVGCRYAFIITDADLVVLRFAVEHVGPGIAHSRGAREMPMLQRVQSNETELSSSLQAMSISHTGESHTTESYVETGRGLEYQNPQYQAIPWGNQGDGVLTVRLAIFYLCLMAGHGWNDIKTEYPGLDTWCQLDDGGFRHNTSGVFKMTLSTTDVLAVPGSDQVEEDTQQS